jgi:hypothetical protein
LIENPYMLDYVMPFQNRKKDLLRFSTRVDELFAESLDSSSANIGVILFRYWLLDVIGRLKAGRKRMRIPPLVRKAFGKEGFSMGFGVFQWLFLAFSSSRLRRLFVT